MELPASRYAAGDGGDLPETRIDVRREADSSNADSPISRLAQLTF
jgi:hypothetical protein